MKLKLQGWRGPAPLPAPTSLFRYPATRGLRRAPLSGPTLPGGPPTRAPPKPPSIPTHPPTPGVCCRQEPRVLPAPGCQSPWPPRRAAPPPPTRPWGRGAGRGSGGAGRGSGGERGSERRRVREGELRARAPVYVCECVCVSLSVSRLGSGALAGPPAASFPVLSPGPHRVETGHLVKRCFWPSGRRGDGRRKAPSPEFFLIKSDKKFREK